MRNELSNWIWSAMYTVCATCRKGTALKLPTKIFSRACCHSVATIVRFACHRRSSQAVPHDPGELIWIFTCCSEPARSLLVISLLQICGTWVKLHSQWRHSRYDFVFSYSSKCTTHCPKNDQRCRMRVVLTVVKIRGYYQSVQILLQIIE